MSPSVNSKWRRKTGHGEHDLWNAECFQDNALHNPVSCFVAGTPINPIKRQ